MIAAAILSLAVLAAANSLMFHLNARGCASRWVMVAYHSMNVLGALSVVASAFLRDSTCIAFQIAAANCAYIWMFFACYGIMSSFAVWVLTFWTKRKYNVHIIAVILAAAAVTGHFNYSRIRTVELDFIFDGERYVLSDSTFSGRPDRSIVFASDIHLGDGIGPARLEKFVDAINGLEPDVVLFGGDLLDGSARIPDAQGCQNILSGIRADEGVFAVYGNHEHYTRTPEETSDFYRESGIVTLRDSSVMVGDWLYVSGADDRSGGWDFPDGGTWLPSGNVMRIGLSHRPDNLDLFDRRGYDLSLCGHTHNGQFFPGNLLLGMVRKRSGDNYTYGLFRLPEGSAGFVSCGLGIWGPHFRICSRSEIVVVNIHDR